ncbi:CAP domain-containing protein [Scenedesmus sp. NREL 46B-D3]|nr:CAP domain-containing protein [Scenedesmus sp. NREL 46B-D3]
MSPRANFARSVLLAGLLLALAVAWSVPVVQGRLLQGRGDREDGYSPRRSGRQSGSRYSSERQSWGYQSNSRSKEGSDSSTSNAALTEEPQYQPAGSSVTATNNAMQPTTGSTTSPSTPSQETAATPAAPGAAATPAVNPVAGSTTGGPADAVLNSVLALHNQLRAKHSSPPLTWSTALEQTAMAWAKGCKHSHSTNRAGNYNELIAWGNRPFTQAVTDQWYAEIKDYNFNSPPSRYQDNTAHFTQVVWKSTTELGCGYATCSDGPYYVCHYAPTGNTNGGFAANVSPPAA